MNDQLTAQGIRLREYLPGDIPAYVELANRLSPDLPTTVEKEEYDESIYPPDNPRLRYAIKNNAGQLIGFCFCVLPFWQNAPGVYMMRIKVDSDWRRRGIGRAALAEIEAYARRQGANRLRTDCYEYQDYSIGFLKAMGFTNFGLRYESELDLNTFDETKFGNVIDQAIADDYEFTTLATERTIEPEADRLLYEVNWRTTLDVPIPGSTFSKPTFENFRDMFLDGPDNDPANILIAKQAGQYVGHTIVMLRPDRPAYTRMTGVLREHRGHNLALVLKLLSFRLMKERGYTLTRTTNDTANAAILRLNEKLGYQRLPGFMLWEKVLST